MQRLRMSEKQLPIPHLYSLRRPEISVHFPVPFVSGIEEGLQRLRNVTVPLAENHLQERITFLQIVTLGTAQGNVELLEAAKIYYAFHGLYEKVPEAEKLHWHKAWYYLQSNTYLIHAIDLRDRAIVLGKEGDFRAARKTNEMAQVYNRLHVYAENLAKHPEQIPTPTQSNVELQLWLHESFLDYGQLGKYADLEVELARVRSGIREIPGVDPRWERVRFQVAPSRKNCPQAYVAFDMILEEVTKGVDLTKNELVNHYERARKEKLRGRAIWEEED